MFSLPLEAKVMLFCVGITALIALITVVVFKIKEWRQNKRDSEEKKRLLKVEERKRAERNTFLKRTQTMPIEKLVSICQEIGLIGRRWEKDNSSTYDGIIIPIRDYVGYEELATTVASLIHNDKSLAREDVVEQLVDKGYNVHTFISLIGEKHQDAAKLLNEIYSEVTKEAIQEDERKAIQEGIEAFK